METQRGLLRTTLGQELGEILRKGLGQPQDDLPSSITDIFK